MSSALHCHSTFSKLDAYGLPNQMVRRAEELKIKALAITDHGNTSAHPKLEQACKDSSVKPIYGVELYVNTKERHKNHITVLAKNLTGYRNLLNLSSLAYDEDHFYYMPAVDLEDIYKYQEGLIILSGCLSGVASELILDGKTNQAEATLIEMNSYIDDFYIEIQPLDISESRTINPILIKFARELEIPLVATNDSHFIRSEDAELQHFLAMVRRRTNYEKLPGTLSKRCAIAGEEQFSEWLLEYGKEVQKVAMENQDKIADLIEDFELPKAKPVQISDESEEVRYEKLVEMCKAGWKFRGIQNKDKKYLERVRHELDVIRSKGYIDYFMIVADMVVWAKENNILVAPARGSAGGSLVSYLLRITEIDPIKFNLMFERFLDPSRKDAPDIDIDFQDDRREEVKEYVRKKYGADKVANVAGYSLFHDKSLLDDIGRCYCISPIEIKKYKNELPENGGNKPLQAIIRSLRQDYPQIPSNIASMIGQLRGFTVHAAGVIVSTMPLANTTTMMRNGTIALDKRDAEYMNLLKIDVLSLSTLRIISHALNKMGMTVNELYSLPLDNPKVLQGFKDADMQGIFQYSGDTTKKVCGKVLDAYDVSTANMEEMFNAVIDVNTLSRPASLNNGSTKRYIKNEHERIHPIIDKHTATTRGQIIYQEQIMKALRDGGLDWSDITTVRKIMSGKDDMEKLPPIRQQFIDNLVANGTTKELASDVWNRLGDEGAYGFNYSHCVAYSMVAYYTMYLKVMSRTIFYWANLMVNPDDEDLLQEFERTGGEILPVKYGKSDIDWSIDGENLRAGYVTVKGIGEKSAIKILNTESKDKLANGVRKKLESAGAFDEDCDKKYDHFGTKKMLSVLDNISNRTTVSELRKDGSVTVGGVIFDIEYKSKKETILSKGEEGIIEYDCLPYKEADTYVNFSLYDGTEKIVCTIPRMTYNRCSSVVNAIDRYKDEEIVIIDGHYSKEYSRIFVDRLGVIS